MSANSILETILVYGTAAAILGGIGWLISFVSSGGKLRGSAIAEALEEALANPQIMEEYWKEMESSAHLIQDTLKKQAAFDHVTNLRVRFKMIKNNEDGFKKLNRQEKALLGELINNANGLEEKLSTITDPILRSENQTQINQVNSEIERLISAVPPKLPSIQNYEPTSVNYKVADDDLSSEIKLLKENAARNRDTALKAIDELVEIDPEFEKDIACQNIEMRYIDELEKSERIATITILKKRRGIDIKRALDNAKVAGLSEEQAAGNLARVNKRYDDEISKLESDY